MLAKHRSSAYKVSLKGATTTRLPHLKRWFGATRSGLADFPVIAQPAWVWINGGRAMSSPVVRSRNVLKRNSMRFAAALLAALASFFAGPNAALAAAPRHHDQVLVGHSWGGAVITEAGNDPQVAGLVYLAAEAPNSGESFNDWWKGYTPMPGREEIKPYGNDGYVALKPLGVRQLAQVLPKEQVG